MLSVGGQTMISVSFQLFTIDQMNQKTHSGEVCNISLLIRACHIQRLSTVRYYPWTRSLHLPWAPLGNN